jgi:uncharacterized protein involved in exopolysaccharide biosynthesis
MFLEEQAGVPLLGLLRRHLTLAVTVTLSCVVLAALITQMLPHRYQSEMKVLVNNERADLVITPGKDQATTTPTEVSETQVNSEIELLKSNDLIEQVVLSRKLYLPFQRDKAAPPTRKSIELATLNLNKALSVSSLRKTNIIDVTYKASDPDAAVAILQDLGNGYFASHLAAHSAPGINKFFGEQVERYKDELADARAALASYHEHEQLFSLPQQQTALVARLDTVSTQLQEVSEQIQVQETRLKENARQLSAASDRITTQVKRGTDQAALGQLEVMRTQLQNRRRELATKFKSTDRLVAEVDDQVSNTSHQIEQVSGDGTIEETTDVNPLHQSIAADASRTQLDLSGLYAQHRSLERIRQDCLRQLVAMDDSSLELDPLEQRVKEAEDNYQIYEHRLSEARLDQALDREKLSNVVMIEKPVASPIAVSPNLPLNLAFGFLVGICLAFALCYSREIHGGRPPVAPRALHDLRSSTVFQAASGD